MVACHLKWLWVLSLEGFWPSKAWGAGEGLTQAASWAHALIQPEKERMPMALLPDPESKSGAVTVAAYGRTDGKPSRGADEINYVPHDLFHSTGELSAGHICCFPSINFI